MSEYLDQLKVKRLDLWGKAQKIPAAAVEEKRELTAEEDANFERFNTDLKAIDEQIEKHADAETRARRADELFSANPTAVGQSQEQRVVIDDDATFHDLAKIVRGDGEGKRARDFGYSPDFKRAMKNQSFGAEMRALAVGANGPSTVPVAFADFVAVYQRTMNPTYALSTVIATSNGQNLTIPRLTTDLTQYNPGEATAITESTPTISSVTLSVTSYKALSYVSQELAQDEEVGLEGLIARSAARAIALAAGTDFTTGANGFISLGTNGGTATGTAYGTVTETFFAAPDVVTLFYSLAAPYRMVGQWQVSSTALAKIRKFVTQTGSFIWSPGLDGPQSDTLMGRPIYENPAMAAVASATKSVAFGDFSSYIIKEVVPIRVEASSEFLFNLDQVAYKSVWRAGGTLPDAIAIKYMVSANS